MQDKSYQLLQLAARLAVVFVNGSGWHPALGLWGLPTPHPQAGAVVSHTSPAWLLWDALLDAGLCLKCGNLGIPFGDPGWSGQWGETPSSAPLTQTCWFKATRWLWQDPSPSEILLKGLCLSLRSAGASFCCIFSSSSWFCVPQRQLQVPEQQPARSPCPGEWHPRCVPALEEGLALSPCPCATASVPLGCSCWLSFRGLFLPPYLSSTKPSHRLIQNIY